jgi:hypothetical protein
VTLTAITPPPNIGPSQPIVFTLSREPVAIGVEYLTSDIPASNTGAWDAVYGDCDQNAGYTNGRFSYRYRSSSREGNTWTIRPPGDYWPGRFHVLVDESPAPVEAAGALHLPYTTYSGAETVAANGFGNVNTPPMSWGALVSLSAPHTGLGSIFSNQPGSYVGWALLMANGEVFGNYCGSGGDVSSINGRPSLNANLKKAYAVSASYAHPTLKFYVNGVLVDTVSSSYSPGGGSGNFYFGSSPRPGVSASPTLRIHGCWFRQQSAVADSVMAEWATSIKSTRRFVAPDVGIGLTTQGAWCLGTNRWGTFNHDGLYYMPATTGGAAVSGFDAATTLGW